MASGVNVSVSIKQNSQNIANNTSSVTISVKVGTYGNSFNLNGMPVKVVLSGNLSGTYNTSVKLDKEQTKTAWSRTFTVTHSSTGTAKVTAKATVETNISAGTITKSASKTLTTIPRASEPSVSGTLQLGNGITVNTNRKSTAFTHTLSWSWAGKSGTIATGVGASYVWTPSIATFAPYLTNATSATCTITCVTYSGGYAIGTKAKTFTLSIPSSVVPSCSLAVTDTNGYLETYDAFVLNKSQVRATVTGAGIYGSTISKYAATLGGVTKSGTASAVDLGAPLTTGSQTVTGTVTDSRGRTKSASQAITVANYTNPTLNASAFRATNGVEDDESTTVRVSVSGTVCDVNSKGINSGTVKIESREVNGEWTQRQSQDRGQTFSFDADFSGFEATSRYEIRVTVTDSFGTVAQMTLFIMTAQPVMDLHSTGEGIGFATTAQQGQFRVGIPSVFMDKVSLEHSSSARQGLYLDEAGRLVLGDDAGNIVAANNLILGNNAALGSYLADNETISALLRMNPNNQVEFNWTSGGLKGRVMKKLWEGTWSRGGTITIPEYAYYNVFLLRHNYANCPIIVTRMSIGGSGLIGASAFAMAGYDTLVIMGIQALAAGENKLQMRSAIRNAISASNGNMSYSDITIEAIYGVL